MFTQPEEAKTWGRRLFDALSEQLTTEEMDALRDYKGQGFRKINDTLRRSGPTPPARLTDTWRKILHLDIAVARIRIPESVTVYRGHRAQPEWIESFETGNLSGRFLADKAFWSTSLLVDVALEFYTARPESYFLLEIHLPAGSYGVYLDVEEIDDQQQHEILLARNPLLYVAETFRDAQGRRRVVGEMSR